MSSGNQEQTQRPAGWDWGWEQDLQQIQAHNQERCVIQNQRGQPENSETTMAHHVNQKGTPDP